MEQLLEKWVVACNQNVIQKSNFLQIQPVE